MGWFKNLTQRIGLRMLKYSVPEGWTLQDQATYSNRGVREIGPNPRQFLDEYKRAIWTYIAVKAKAESIAGMPWLLKRRKKGEDETIPEHDLVDFFEQPAPKMVWDEWCFETVADLELMGNSFNEKVKTDSKGDEYPHALALVRLDPSKMRYQLEDDPKKLIDGIKKYIYVPGSETDKNELDPDEVLHIRYFDPSIPHAGLAPVQPSWDTTMLIRRALRFNIGIFKNGGEPSIALMTEAKLDATTRERMAAEWLARHANESGQSGGVAVLSHGIKAEAFSITHRDMQFQTLKESAVQEVLAAHRVPPVLVGMDTSSYASAATQMKVFREEVGQPLLKKILDKLTMEVIGEMEDAEEFYLEPDYRKMEDPSDAQQRKTFSIQLAQAGAMDLNELREQFGLPRKPELDKPPAPPPAAPGGAIAPGQAPAGAPGANNASGAVPGKGEKPLNPAKAEEDEVEAAPKPKQEGSLPKKVKKSLVQEIRELSVPRILQGELFRLGENGHSRMLKMDDVVSEEEAKELVANLLKDCGQEPDGKFGEGNTCGAGGGSPMPDHKDYPSTPIEEKESLWRDLQAAADPKEVAKVKRSYIKRIDAETPDTKVSDGLLVHFVAERNRELRAMNEKPRSNEEARADRILNIRDSSGRAKPRKF